MSGPFFVASPRHAPSSPVHRREPRDWEREDVIVDKMGYHAPAHVGKQGRKKERAKMERKAREQEVDDDEGWFAHSGNSKRSDPRDGHGKDQPKLPTKRLTFGSSMHNASRLFDLKPRSERSLRDRLNGEFDRPPPTQPRGRPRSNSLLDRIGQQVDYPRSREEYRTEGSEKKRQLASGEEHEKHGRYRSGYSR